MGDYDVAFGVKEGHFIYFQNTGTKRWPQYTRVSWGDKANLFKDDTGLPTQISTRSSGTCFDVDNDNDMDCIVGASDGRLRYLKNVGIRSSTPKYKASDPCSHPWLDSL